MTTQDHEEVSAAENIKLIKVSLMDLPAEVVLEHLLPALPPGDIATVSSLDRRFHSLATDEALWMELIRRDYAYDPALLSPPSAKSGWAKRVYQGLTDPRIFVWGSSDNGRLGTDLVRRQGNVVSFNRYAQLPIELDGVNTAGRSWKQGLQDSLANYMDHGASERRNQEALEKEQKIQVVDLQAGGWSFTARTADGGIYVWGQLDGMGPSFGSQDWHRKYHQLPEPTRVHLPCKAVGMSVGRRHLVVLDEDNLIWEMTAWGTAFHHTSPQLVAPTSPGSSLPRRHVISISAGWNHTACLTSAGDILVWYPLSSEYESERTPEDQLDSTAPDRQERVVKYGKVGQVVHPLEQVPSRPDGVSQAWTQYEESISPAQREEGDKVIKIASGNDFILALKANGEVWYHTTKSGQIDTWEYLPHFSGPSIKHITAQYDLITSYSTQTIYNTHLPGQLEAGAGADLRPTPVEGLDDKEVIQVASGDYHTLALTSTGEIWGWGTGLNGQLGNGDLGKTQVPTRVKFEKDVFVFGITAAGHHSGALVLGGHREPDGSKAKEKSAEKSQEDDLSMKETQAKQDEFEQLRSARMAPVYRQGILMGGPPRIQRHIGFSDFGAARRYAEIRRQNAGAAEPTDETSESAPVGLSDTPVRHGLIRVRPDGTSLPENNISAPRPPPGPDSESRNGSDESGPMRLRGGAPESDDREPKDDLAAQASGEANDNIPSGPENTASHPGRLSSIRVRGAYVHSDGAHGVEGGNDGEVTPKSSTPNSGTQGEDQVEQASSEQNENMASTGTEAQAARPSRADAIRVRGAYASTGPHPGVEGGKDSDESNGQDALRLRGGAADEEDEGQRSTGAPRRGVPAFRVGFAGRGGTIGRSRHPDTLPEFEKKESAKDKFDSGAEQGAATDNYQQSSSELDTSTPSNPPPQEEEAEEPIGSRSHSEGEYVYRDPRLPQIGPGANALLAPPDEAQDDDATKDPAGSDGGSEDERGRPQVGGGGPGDSDPTSEVDANGEQGTTRDLSHRERDFGATRRFMDATNANLGVGPVDNDSAAAGDKGGETKPDDHLKDPLVGGKPREFGPTKQFKDRLREERRA